MKLEWTYLGKSKCIAKAESPAGKFKILANTLDATLAPMMLEYNGVIVDSSSWISALRNKAEEINLNHINNKIMSSKSLIVASTEKDSMAACNKFKCLLTILGNVADIICDRNQGRLVNDVYGGGVYAVVDVQSLDERYLDILCTKIKDGAKGLILVEPKEIFDTNSRLHQAIISRLVVITI